MIRGTTPTHTFKIPLDTSRIESVRVIYSQNDVVKIVKTGDSCTIGPDTITVKLTQEETLSLDSCLIVKIQIRVLTTSGDALVSKVVRVTVDECLENEVIE